MLPLRTVKVESDEIFIFHDVVSLFTKTPVDVILSIVQKHLQQDKTPQTHKTHSRGHIPVANVHSQIHLLPVQGHHLQTEGGVCNGRPTIGHHEWLLYGGPEEEGHSHHNSSLQTVPIEALCGRHTRENQDPAYSNPYRSS